MALHDGLLARAGVAPGLVIARLPSAMRHDEDLDAGTAHRAVDGPQIVEQPDVVGDVLDPWPEFSAFRKEIVIGIDEQERRSRLVIGLR